MQEMASTQSSISEVLTDLNMTNNPSSSHTNTTAPEIAVAGQESIAIGLLASALGGPAAVGKMFRDPGNTPFSAEINARMRQPACGAAGFPLPFLLPLPPGRSLSRR
jgi:hypothetical protein